MGREPDHATILTAVETLSARMDTHVDYLKEGIERNRNLAEEANRKIDAVDNRVQSLEEADSDGRLKKLESIKDQVKGARTALRFVFGGGLLAILTGVASFFPPASDLASWIATKLGL